MPTQAEIQERSERARSDAQAAIDHAFRIDSRYHPFIDLLPQRKRLFPEIRGDKTEVGIWVPYLNAEGRLLMAHDDHKSRGEAMSFMEPTFEDIAGKIICKVGIASPIHGVRYGTAQVFLDAQYGPSASNPFEVAETSAIARALRFMSYTFADQDTTENPMAVNEMMASDSDQDISDDQFEKLAEMLEERGVWREDIPELVNATVQSYKDAKYHIGEMNAQEESLEYLTSKIFGTYVYVLRNRAKVSQEEIMEYLDGKKVRDLDGKGQRNLIGWIKLQQQELNMAKEAESNE